MNNVELLPCPFCGSKAKVTMCGDNFIRYEVNCTNLSCDVYLANELCFNEFYDSAHYFASHEEAVDAWNKLSKEPVQIMEGSTFESGWIVDGRHYKWIDEDEDPVFPMAEFTIFYSCLCNDICVTDLKVRNKYRGKGLSYKLLDCAVKKFGARYLAVEKNNHIAKHVYDKYGFEVIDEDDDLYYMSYTEH